VLPEIAPDIPGANLFYRQAAIRIFKKRDDFLFIGLGGR
jgi:hypothetical protein